jgi:hypothetical protein
VSLSDVMTLLKFLDGLFSLGGRLVEAAQGKHPELVITPLPDLAALDNARRDALKRVQ